MDLHDSIGSINKKKNNYGKNKQFINESLLYRRFKMELGLLPDNN